jgi:hypothetical protein
MIARSTRWHARLAAAGSVPPECLHYDWPDPQRIVMTSSDASARGDRPGHVHTLLRQPGGRTAVVREGKNSRGRLLLIAGKPILAGALADTVKAIEARNCQVGQVPS